MDSDAHDLDGILAIEVRLHASSTADTSPRPLFLGGVEPGGIDVWGELLRDQLPGAEDKCNILTTEFMKLK